MQYDAEARFRIPDAWLKALEEEAQEEGLSVSDIYRRAIRKHLGRRAAVPRKQKSTR